MGRSRLAAAAGAFRCKEAVPETGNAASAVSTGMGRRASWSIASARARKGAIWRRQRSGPFLHTQRPSSPTWRSVLGEKRKYQLLDPLRALLRWMPTSLNLNSAIKMIGNVISSGG
jgi:hypothetical protein